MVIFKTPRNFPILGHFFFLSLSIASIFFLYVSTLHDFYAFCAKIDTIRIDSFSAKLPAAALFPIIYLAILIAIIKNNTKSQPIESFLVLLSLLFASLFLLFGNYILFLWAHAHGYHLDHYESAHKGGWYIFKLTTPSASPA